MNRSFLLLILITIIQLTVRGCCSTVCAQNNALIVGANCLKLDAPDALGSLYIGEYRRQFSGKFVTVSLSGGYFSKQDYINLYNDISIKSHTRERITAALTVALSLVESTNSLLRIGAGPSVWHRKDIIFERADYTIGSSGSAVDLVVQRRKINQTDTGFHVMTEYERDLTKRFFVSVRVTVFRFQETGVNPMIGVYSGYKF